MTKTNIILLLILFFGFLVRTLGLSSFPPALNWDEVSHGYNAYSILKTGKDEWGQTFPLVNFRAYGDYPTTLYMYLTIPWVALLGLSEISIRLTSVIFGTLMILVSFFLSKLFVKDKYICLFVAFVAALSPWTFLLSRQALQAMPAVTLLALGVLFFLLGLNKRWYFYLSSIFFGLSAYGYHNTRILVPAICGLLIIFFIKKLSLSRKDLLIFVSILTLFYIPLVWAIFSGEASARATWVGIIDSGAINRINQLRGQSGLPGDISTYLYNKPTYFIYSVVLNYLSYFDPRFLAIYGGSHYQFSIPGYGVMHFTEALFFYLGFGSLLFRVRRITLLEKFLLSWLLISPLPAAITRDPYQVVRATTMLPVVYIFVGIGVNFIIQKLKSEKFKLYTLVIVVLLEICLFGYYLFNFVYIYPVKYSSAWQYGYKQAAKYIEEKQQLYENIYITKTYGEPHEFLLFYLKHDPTKYQNDINLVRYRRSNWYWVDKFDKYNFLNDWEIKEKLKGRDGLLITRPGNYPEGARYIDSIYFLDNKTAFDIVEL